MQKTIRQVLSAGVGTTLIGGAAVGVGHFRFRRQVHSEVTALIDRGRSASRKFVYADDLAGLPPPVQRWLLRANVVGRPRPGIVHLTQTGIMRGQADQAWMPVHAEQYFTTDPPGFEWIATMQMNPLMWVTGRDRYFDGEGAMDMLAMSLIPVVHARGPELNQGVLLRYLTETVWFPAAVLSPLITWQPIDNRSARATLEYRGTRASATFIIDENGDVLRAEAERYREENGNYALRSWSIPMTEYGEFAGTWMPVAGDAIWRLDSGDLPYYRWRITSVSYDELTSLTEPIHMQGKRADGGVSRVGLSSRRCLAAISAGRPSAGSDAVPVWGTPPGDGVDSHDGATASPGPARTDPSSCPHSPTPRPWPSG